MVDSTTLQVPFLAAIILANDEKFQDIQKTLEGLMIFEKSN